jgi:hypothetical protein
MTMAGGSRTATYARMVAEAEAAVAAVKDPELRRVAFEKILATLLEAEAPSSAGPKSHPKLAKAASENLHEVKRPARQAREGPKAYVETLIDDGFFKKQRTIAEVKEELANRGHHIALTSLSGPLMKLTQRRRLRRQKIAANGGKGTKTAYGYSNW